MRILSPKPTDSQLLEGIVSAIGSWESDREALSNSRLITRQVIQEGLDSQTTLSIISIRRVHSDSTSEDRVKRGLALNNPNGLGRDGK